jgi:hypothetical protein
VWLGQERAPPSRCLLARVRDTLKSLCQERGGLTFRIFVTRRDQELIAVEVDILRPANLANEHQESGLHLALAIII